MKHLKPFTEPEIPIEQDTNVLYRQSCKVGEWNAFLESWTWDGIQAFSIIFKAVDVMGLTDDQLKESVRTITGAGTVTIGGRDGDYVFVNYGFKLDS